MVRLAPTVARLSVCLLAASAALSAQVLVVPTDVQLPGTQPGEIGAIQSPDKCDNCHGGYDLAVEPAHNWRGSMMAQAARDPIFWATVAIAEHDFPGAGDLCIRCHTPDGWLGGRSTPTDGSALTAADGEGVTCDACHRMTDPDGSEWIGVQNAPFLAHDDEASPTGWYGAGELVILADSNTKLGPYADATPNHGFQASSFHRDAAFCGSCHDVSNPVVGDLAPNHGALAPLPGGWSGVPGSPVDGKAAFDNPPFAYGIVERTFSEHQASAFATLRVSDYATLPPELQDGAIGRAHDAAVAAHPSGDYVDGTPRTFTCQTCHLVPVTGEGCNKPGTATRTDLPLHDMTGGNVWIPDVIKYLDAQGDLVLGGGLVAAQIAALDAGKARALGMLRDAAALQVDGDLVRVVNLTGHKLISGYPEGRRMWLHVTFRDAQGGVLREDGAYGPLDVLHEGEPLVVETILDLEDAHVWNVHQGVSSEWAQALVSLGFPASRALAYDRQTGAVSATLGDAAALPPGAAVESFHFALNDTVIADHRIPPYGLAYDTASVRNVLPVPATLYGDPGPGGVFRHWDEVALAPPASAATAEIELLYQSTSWEYVQFLALANDGSVAHLAATGDDLLEAWLATGMAEPVVMASTTWSAGPSPWVDLGHALAGTQGPPSLVGLGSLQGGTPVSLELTDARPAGTTFLVIGLASITAPFKGGVLVPYPDLLLGPLPLDGDGALTIGFAWPAGLPSAATLFWQHWMQDPAGPVGWAASNAVSSTTP